MFKSSQKIKKIAIVLFVVIIALACAFPVLAATQEDAKAETAVQVAENVQISENSLKAEKGFAAAAVVAVVAAAGAIGMAIAISKAVESMARQPEASGDIRTSLLLGLVFIETAIIYALIVAILVVFVL